MRKGDSGRSWFVSVALTLAALQAGCGKKDPPAPEHAPAPASVSPPAASASAAPTATGQFRVAAKTGPLGPALYALGDATFLVSGRVIFRVDDKGLHQDVTLQKGFPGALIYGASYANEEEGDAFQMLGSWPDAAWIQAFGSTGGYDFQVVRATYRWSKDHWQQVEQGDALRGVAPWRKGTAVALAGSPFELKLQLGGNRGNLAARPAKTPWADAEDKAKDAAAAASGSAEPAAAESSAPAATAIASAPPAAVSAAASAEPAAGGEDAGRTECRTELAGFPEVRNFLSPPAPGGIVAFESGEIFVASTTCADEHQSWAVERFPAIGAKGKIDRIASPHAGRQSYLALVGRSPSEVYLYEPEGSALKRFDGTQWRDESLPGDGKLTELSVSSQGTLWMVQGGKVYRRSAGAAWEAVALPKEAGEVEAVSVAAPSDEAVWVIAKVGNAHLVLTNLAQIPPAFDLPSSVDGQAAAGSKADYKKGNTVVRLPFTPVCEQPYVLLIDHSPAAAKEFPEVAERIRGKPELAGVELVTETSQKWTVLGATAPNVATATKLVEAMKGVPGVDARLFCHVPKVKSRIPLEAASK